MAKLRTDVAIIGGGPAGSTAGTLLKKYRPDLNVTILEKAKFPRDHVGESQLPAITRVLDEMGVWDKVEAANFPIKLGGTYRWGATDELWYLNFVPPEDYIHVERPAPFAGQRRELAFQVDRSIYDKVLLDHAREMGCAVHEETGVKQVTAASDFVTGLEIEGPEFDEPTTLKARYYVDASGETAILRRALGIETDMPTTLRNIAFWDYWQDADWAETAGPTATRIQVMSLGWGWIWFIPISEKRTSIGLVLPSSYYKESGKRPEELYHEAVKAEPMIARLTRNATAEGKFTATKDWNFLTSRLAGDNWFLVGDSCGFADPILSAGMTLAHTSGVKAACAILELYRKELPADWIRQEYSDSHRTQIRHHMRFAEFWYAGNGRFTDLKEYCAEIAESAGLKLNAEEAFRWLGAGGFALDHPGLARAATFPLGGIKLMALKMTGDPIHWVSKDFNVFRTNLEGADEEPFGHFAEGGVKQIVCLKRDGKTLPIGGMFTLILQLLGKTSDGNELLKMAVANALHLKLISFPSQARVVMEALEALVVEGWVVGEYDPSKPKLEMIQESSDR